MEGLALKCESTEPASQRVLSVTGSSDGTVPVTAAVLRLVLGDMFVHKGHSYAFISGKHTPKVTLGRSQ